MNFNKLIHDIKHDLTELFSIVDYYKSQGPRKLIEESDKNDVREAIFAFQEKWKKLESGKYDD